MEPITVNYKVLDPRAKVPAYATPGSAAADLCAVLDEPLTLAPMERALVPTGLAIELPGAHTVALVYARSGLSIKHGLCMANGVGVIDSDYRGELKVPMVNLGKEPYTIQPGERVAQLCSGAGAGRYHPRRGRLWLDGKINLSVTLRVPAPLTGEPLAGRATKCETLKNDVTENAGPCGAGQKDIR